LYKAGKFLNFISIDEQYRKYIVIRFEQKEFDMINNWFETKLESFFENLLNETKYLFCSLFLKIFISYYNNNNDMIFLKIKKINDMKVKLKWLDLILYTHYSNKNFYDKQKINNEILSYGIENPYKDTTLYTGECPRPYSPLIALNKFCECIDFGTEKDNDDKYNIEYYYETFKLLLKIGCDPNVEDTLCDWYNCYNVIGKFEEMMPSEIVSASNIYNSDTIFPFNISSKDFVKTENNNYVLCEASTIKMKWVIDSMKMEFAKFNYPTN
jgi:hypothetical protein